MGVVVLPQWGVLSHSTLHPCRVDSNDVVKIGDFGLSRDIYKQDYYKIKDKTRPLPVKWMALECLESHKFSTKSDVVSMSSSSQEPRNLSSHFWTPVPPQKARFTVSFKTLFC